MTLEEVLEENRRIRSLAANLNRRAGTQVFPIMSETELETWMRNAHNGARSRAEIKDLDALRLPALDPALVAKVQVDNPDTIVVLRVETPVDYSEKIPKVRINTETMASNAWRCLPDSEITLPGGRVVKVVVLFSWHESVSGTDMVDLKQQCAVQANKKLWTAWEQAPPTYRPDIPFPDLSIKEPVFPEIVEASYGVSLIDETELKAYGTLKFFYERDPWLKIVWFQTRAEAVSARAASEHSVPHYQKKIIAQNQHAETLKKTEEIKESLEKIPRNYDHWRHLDVDLRAKILQQIEVRIYPYLNIEALTRFINESATLLQLAESAHTV